jgi:hypothetical protein
MVYFSLPMLNRFPKQGLEKYLDKEIAKFSKDKYFDNLYKLSSFVEKELIEDNGKDCILANNYERISYVMQLVFITYLLIMCVLMVYIDYGSEPVAIVINGLIFIIKIMFLAWDGRRFFMERSMLFEIAYEKYTLQYKWIRLLTSIMVVVCYGLLFVWDIFYPITLILEVVHLRPFQLMITYLIEGLMMMKYIMAAIQCILLAYAFALANSPSKHNDVLGVFLSLNYELLLIQSVYMVVEDTTSYPFFRSIPYMIPIFFYIAIIMRSLFVGSLVYQFTKKVEAKYSTW